ncbi:hypothetical protein EMMF5_000557 [Cystobasidiomycetes sp. EMM_F5]
MQSQQAGDQRNTIYVGGFGQEMDSTTLYSAFLPFGEIMDVQIPPDPTKRDSATHRGFGFVTFQTHEDALDAVDNMHLNEIAGRVLKVNIAKPSKAQMNVGSNRAIWEDEEWLRQHNKPLGQSSAADKQEGGEES